jgi:hypothetical protein
VVVPDGVLSGYLALALRLDRLVPGLVDAGSVEPALRREVAREPAPVPADLVRQAGRLAVELSAADLPAGADARRRLFLAGQLEAVECTARRLTGQPIRFVREIEACFGLTARMGRVDDYAAAHDALADLLPGPRPLAQRMAAHRRAHVVPADRIGPALAALSALLRERTRRLVALPPGESVTYRVVDDAPWSALHQYHGDFRSTVTVNAAALPRRAQLAQLVAHEAYPGHHTERCRKQAGLLRAGWLEHSVLVASSPQSVLAEGTAELGLDAVLGPGWGPVVADVLAEQGLGFDGELVERVTAVGSRLDRVRQDAALLLHGRGAAVDEVRGYLCRWLLVDEPRADQILRFLRHPIWRGYSTTYVEGAELVRRWWARGPGPDRLRRLLDEPLTPAGLRADLAS